MRHPAAPPAATSAAAVLAKASVRAADLLALKRGELAEVLGVSETTISRAANGGSLPANAKTLELAALFVRVYRSLDSIVGGDDRVAARWMRGPNDALGAPPVDRIKTVEGLMAVLSYLDARRALV
ncbi:MAG: MbcA/ParS/Xre antitoxin family protein [Pseudomonadota bacterium]